MKNVNEAGVGMFGKYWEYRRGTHRRLFSFDNFDEDEMLVIGRRLEGIDKKGYHKISLYGQNIHVYINEDGVATYLKE